MRSPVVESGDTFRAEDIRGPDIASPASANSARSEEPGWAGSPGRQANKRGRHGEAEVTAGRDDAQGDRRARRPFPRLQVGAHLPGTRPYPPDFRLQATGWRQSLRSA